mgnify:CR=1 FL=1
MNERILDLFTKDALETARNEVSSITNKRLLRGHVTPIRMTTPELEPCMMIDFSIGGNNLGEKVDKVTVLMF